MEKKHLVVFSNGNDFDSILKCPICGFDYNHIKRVSEKGENNKEDNGNQGFVKIVFWGECEHYFSLCFDGHKGNVFSYFLEENGMHEKDIDIWKNVEKIGELNKEIFELKEENKKLKDK